MTAFGELTIRAATPPGAIDYSAYPGASDVSALFSAAGLVSDTNCAALLSDASGINFESAIRAAVARWEQETGYFPFLAGDTETRTFYDEFGSGFYSLLGGVIPRSVTAVSVSSITGTGTAETLTQGRQYLFSPYTAAARNMPVTSIEVRRHCWFSTRFGALSVTGRFGYCETLPPDVWEAIRRDAACLVAPEISQAITGGLVTWTEDGVSERYSEDRAGTAISGWSAYRERVLMNGNYRRLAMA